MKTRFLFCVLAAVFAFARAEEESARLSGAEIRAALTDATALYRSGARQYFAADGHTDYWTAGGAHSAGRWHAADDKYCSVWGPNTRSPVCYVVSKHGEETAKDAETAAPVLRWDGEYEAAVFAGKLPPPPKPGE